MQQSKPSLAVIGLDGATFDVIGPLVEERMLPNLGSMMNAGVYGTLASIIPPVTGPAWSVLATGKNPGRLGIFDFINRRHPDDFTLYPIRSVELAGQTFWDILDGAGYRVGILNYPMLVPAYPVDGWMVAGLGASRLHRFAFPNDLKQELDQVTGGYEISVSYGLPKYRENLPQLVDDLHWALTSRMSALERLLSARPVDVLVAVFSVSDVASHTMWQYWENGRSGLLEPHHAEMREAYISIWRSLDEAVGRILEHLSPDGHALVVSDHGFGPNHGVFHVNRWLEQGGYLVRNGNRMAGANRLRERLIEKANPIFGSVFKRVLGSRVHQVLRASVLREMDLMDSQAFALESGDLCGEIFINRQYARARGLDEPEFVDATRAQLKRDLLVWSENEGLAVEVFMADELYAGDKVALAPEMLFVVDNFRCSVSPRFEEPIYDERRHHSMKSGTHRLNGVLIGEGPRILSGRIEGAQLQDIAPTLLHLMDVPVPSSMDGRILAEMLKPEFSAKKRPYQAPTERPVARTMRESKKDEGENFEAVLQRLADLGYLD